MNLNNSNLDDCFDQKTIDNLTTMSNKDFKELNKASLQSEYQQRMKRILREEKSSSRKKWWKDNWMQFFAMIFALIAAIPVIFQLIESILSSIK